LHIELTEMLRCPEPHRQELLVLSTGEMSGRMVMRGVVGCPVCQREFEILDGIVDFTEPVTAQRRGRAVRRTPAPPTPPPPVDPTALQALLDLGGPGGIVVLIGTAARHAEILAAAMGGVHFVGINAPPDVEPLPVLSLLQAEATVPLRDAMARGVVVGGELARTAWVPEGARTLLRGRRLVVESEDPRLPDNVRRLAVGQGLWVGEKG
jgi:uncharacterized protein YbaR (Trm112 family)